MDNLTVAVQVFARDIEIHVDKMLASRAWYVRCPDGPMKRQFRADVIGLACDLARGRLAGEVFRQQVAALNERAALLAERGVE